MPTNSEIHLKETYRKKMFAFPLTLNEGKIYRCYTSKRRTRLLKIIALSLCQPLMSTGVENETVFNAHSSFP